MQSLLKKSTIVLIIFLLIALAFPTLAHAQLCDVVGIFPFNIACSALSFLGFDLSSTSFGETIAKVLVGLTTFIPATIFFGVAGITNWLISIAINIPIVPDGAPPFVNQGFALTRQIANIFFLLILVFIGLATILRLQEYQLQRTLPKLILIALLVNFSALLVGFVVDVANLATNFFLSSIIGAGGFSLNAFDAISTSRNTQISDIFNSGQEDAFLSALALGVILALFFFFATLVYAAIAIIFFLRIIILWTLVMLAPLAFLAFILPATKKWWNQWLSALIQWSFLAVPISFFMWLAQKVLVPGAALPLPPITTLPAPATNSLPFIASVLAPMTALVLLGIGITMSLAVGPGIVSKAVNAGKKIATIGAGVAVGTLATQGLGRYFAKEKRERESGKDTLMSKAERMNFGIDWKNKKLKSLAVGVGTLGMAPLARFGLRTGIRKGVEYGATQGQDIEKKAKEYESIVRSDHGLALENSKAAGIGFLGDQKRAAWVLAFARARGGKGLNELQGQNAADFESGLKHLAAEKPGKLGDVLKHNFDLINDTKAEEIFGPQKGKAMATMLRERFLGDSATKDASGNTVLARDRDQNIEDRDVRAVLELDRVKGAVAAMAAQGKAQWEQDQYLMQEAVSKKLADDIKNTDIDSMSARMLDNPEFRRAIGQWKPWSFIRKVGEEWGSEAIEKIQDEMQAIDPDLKDLAKTNKSFLRAATTRDGNMIMKHWTRADGTDIEDEKDMKAYIKEITTAAPTSPFIQPYENTLIDDEALRRSNQDPSKNYLEHHDSAKNDYISQYRKTIDAQLQEENNLLQWRVSQGHFADFAAAQQTRGREILGHLQQEKSFPRLTPKATQQEELQFKEIVQSPGKTPSRDTRQAFRLVTGAKEAAHYILREREKEMASAASQLKRAEDELAKPLLDPRRARVLGAEIPGLQNRLTTIDTERQKAETRFNALDTREAQIKTALRIP